MSHEIDELIELISDSATAARAHFQIWFTLRGEGKALIKHYADMNDALYVDFFRASTAGHYKLIFIELGCLFDPNEKSSSFRALKELLLDQHPQLVEMIDSSLKEHAELVRNILTIRSKLIAHKELGVTSESIHEKYEVTPNQISDLIDKSCKAINSVSRTVYGPSNGPMAFTTSRLERSIFALLETLNRGRNSSSLRLTRFVRGH